MNGELFIDGYDAYNRYWVSVTDLAGLLNYPPLKAVKTVDYPDENGIRVDLSAPKLDSRTFELTLTCYTVSRISYFRQAVLDGREHTWYWPNLGLTKTLRVKTIGAMNKVGELASCRLTLVDDNPLEGYSYTMPSLYNSTRDLGYLLDGYPFAMYGIVPLLGVEQQLLLPFPAKERISISNSTMNGADYDSYAAYSAARDVTLPLFIYKPKTAFWSGYNAFLYDLVRPGAHTLTYETLPVDDGFGQRYPITGSLHCYYKSSKVTEFAEGLDKLWSKFDLTLCLTNR